MAAYTGVGEDYHAERVGAARFPKRMPDALPRVRERTESRLRTVAFRHGAEFGRIRNRTCIHRPSDRGREGAREAALPSIFGAASQGMAAAGSDLPNAKEPSGPDSPEAIPFN